MEKKNSLEGPINACGRMHTRSEIERKAKELREQAAALDCLAASISWETMKPELEELLWKYFVGRL